MFIVLGMFLFLIIFALIKGSHPDYEIKPIVYEHWWQQYRSSYYLIPDEDKILLSYYTEEEFTTVCMNYLLSCRRRQDLCATVRAFKRYINTGDWNDYGYDGRRYLVTDGRVWAGTNCRDTRDV